MVLRGVRGALACAAPADEECGGAGEHQQGSGREGEGKRGDVPSSGSVARATGSGVAEEGDGEAAGVAVGVLPRSGRAGSSAVPVRATARVTGSIVVPAGYIPPKASAPWAVSLAGASVTVTSPAPALRFPAVKVTSGIPRLVRSGEVTSAWRVPLPSVTVTRTALIRRSRPCAPVKRTAPRKAAVRSPSSNVPARRGSGRGRRRPGLRR